MLLTLGGRKVVYLSKPQCILSIQDRPYQLSTGERLPNLTNPQKEHSHTNHRKGSVWQTPLKRTLPHLEVNTPTSPGADRGWPLRW